jgi:hypothetical protein
MSKDDRRSLAEALSGFGNSDGGLIVWGVYAKKARSDEPDVVQALRPIARLGLFLSDLQGLTPQLVSPGVMGVRHHVIPLSPGADEGYALTLVPRSETDLHMAIGSDQHRFYYRSGSSFLPMEAYMVADRLGRRPQPHLELACRLQAGSYTGTHDKVHVVLSLRNVGRGVALYPALAIGKTERWEVAQYGLDGNGRTGLPRRTTTGEAGSRAVVFAGGADIAIHPGTEFEVTRLTAEVPRLNDSWPDLVLEYGLYCDGFSFEGTTVVDPRAFIASMRESRRG